MSKNIELREPSGSILPAAPAREAATSGAESNAALSARWVQRFRKPGRTEAEAVRLAEAEAHRLAQVTLEQAAAKPIAEAERSDAAPGAKPSDELRGAFERRFLNQGRKPEDAKRLANLAAAPGRKPFFSGATKTELKEAGR